MKQLRSFLTGVALASLCGCATQYQKVGFTGGFSEAQRSRNEFSVSFAGNGYTTGQRAVDLCMLRCADLTLGHGFHYFVLTANKAEFDNSTTITTGNFIPTGYGGGVFFSTTQAVPKPGVANTILCFRESPTFFSEIFDAQKVFDELTQKYSVKKGIQAFPKLSLPKAALGVDLEPITPRVNPNFRAGTSTAHSAEKPSFKVRAFVEGGHAQEAGIRVGDQVLAVDDVPLYDFEKIADLMSRWQIGQTVQVTARRGGNDMKFAVNTIFNPVLRFKSSSEIKGAGPTAEKDVTVFEGATGNMTAFRIAEFGDWENPVDTLDMFKTYAIAAAANAGANGVHILSSPREVQALNPNADKRLGFLCGLLLIPKASLGVEFETGTGYENRRVIRRIQNTDAVQAGLRIGDNILAMNGVDVLRNADLLAKDHMKWEVGQTVEVTVARDGKEVKIPVKTISNH